MTAVEWLVFELKHCKEANGFIVVTPSLLNMLKQKAKAMEKEQNILIYRRGYIDGVGETQLTNSVIKNK
jgi:hypothetical protein